MWKENTDKVDIDIILVNLGRGELRRIFPSLDLIQLVQPIQIQLQS